MRYPLNICKKRRFVIESIRSKIDSIFIGENPSRAYGLGVDVENFREYTFGDDFRKIDWKISSRQPYTVYPKFMVREYREEKSLYLLCLLDASESMAFKMKWETAVATLLTLIEIARKRKDIVSVVVASSRGCMLDIGFMKPKGLSDYLLRIICRGELRPYGVLDLRYIAKVLSKNLNRRTMILFITDIAHDSSDFKYFVSTLTRVGHSLGVLFILEEHELEIPSCGLITIEDMEYDSMLTILEKSEVELVNKLLEKHFNNILSVLKLYEVPFVIITSIDDIMEKTLTFIEIYKTIKVRAYV